VSHTFTLTPGSMRLFQARKNIFHRPSYSILLFRLGATYHHHHHQQFRKNQQLQNDTFIPTSHSRGIREYSIFLRYVLSEMITISVVLPQSMTVKGDGPGYFMGQLLIISTLTKYQLLLLYYFIIIDRSTRPLKWSNSR
jgi:hypothetical protein